MDKYSELKPKIVEAISKLDMKLFPGEKSLTLIDGFASISLEDSLHVSSLGGRSLPMVAIVGDTTGKVYFFGLKRLLPEVQLRTGNEADNNG